PFETLQHRVVENTPPGALDVGVARLRGFPVRVLLESRRRRRRRRYVLLLRSARRHAANNNNRRTGDVLPDVHCCSAARPRAGTTRTGWPLTSESGGF